MKTTRRYYRVDRRQISFVKFILEAYDNVAVVSTLNPRRAVVQITIAPGCEAMVEGIIGGLAGDVELSPVDDFELTALRCSRSASMTGRQSQIKSR